MRELGSKLVNGCVSRGESVARCQRENISVRERVCEWMRVWGHVTQVYLSHNNPMLLLLASAYRLCPSTITEFHILFIMQYPSFVMQTLGYKLGSTDILLYCKCFYENKYNQSYKCIDCRLGWHYARSGLTNNHRPRLYAKSCKVKVDLLPVFHSAFPPFRSICRMKIKPKNQSKDYDVIGFTIVLGYIHLPDTLSHSTDVFNHL